MAGKPRSTTKSRTGGGWCTCITPECPLPEQVRDSRPNEAESHQKRMGGSAFGAGAHACLHGEPHARSLGLAPPLLPMSEIKAVSPPLFTRPQMRLPRIKQK